MADRSIPAVAIQQFLAANAQLRLHALGRVVNTRMDDLGIARGGFLTDPCMPFDHEHIAALECERPGDGETHNTRADHYRVL